jgi:hypothetical protein
MRDIVESMIVNGKEQHDTDTQPDPPSFWMNRDVTKEITAPSAEQPEEQYDDFTNES